MLQAAVAVSESNNTLKLLCFSNILKVSKEEPLTALEVKDRISPQNTTSQTEFGQQMRSLASFK